MPIILFIELKKQGIHGLILLHAATSLTKTGYLLDFIKRLVVRPRFRFEGSNGHDLPTWKRWSKMRFNSVLIRIVRMHLGCGPVNRVMRIRVHAHEKNVRRVDRWRLQPYQDWWSSLVQDKGFGSRVAIDILIGWRWMRAMRDSGSSDRCQFIERNIRIFWWCWKVVGCWWTRGRWRIRHTHTLT